MRTLAVWRIDAAKVLDIMMLAISGGRERTRREYQTLLERAELR